MAEIRDFNKLGQAFWSDYLRRSFITSGELKGLIDKGLSGVTANPTIFEKAIAGSNDYDSQIRALIDEQEKMPHSEIYEALALKDISMTADLLRPLYDSFSGKDGFVSIEVDPELANDAQGMIDQARRYFKTLDKPNVMIKIPATQAGFPAIKTLTSDGINVNVTLIFSIDQYKKAADAYISGLRSFEKRGGDPSKVASVASFFVSRVDTAVDKALEKIKDKKPAASTLEGKIGIANAKVAYSEFRKIFGGPQWKKLEAKGARVQRVLWASTGTKNPSYPDTLYVDNLVGPDTVNTLPPATLKAVFDHGKPPTNTLEVGLEEARHQLKQLSELGIDFDKVTNDLEDEGVAKFSKSLESLYDKINQKRERFLSEPYSELPFSGLSADQRQSIEAALNDLADQNVITRIWNHDYRVWKAKPDEITNRLGWLHVAEVMEENVHRLTELTESVRGAAFTKVILLGMGGSSLAPEMFAKTFGTSRGFLELSILDSTDPGAIRSQLNSLDLSKTLFIVSSKSGKTIETIALFKFFYNEVANKLGEDHAGEHFITITDPNTDLDKMATEYRFRAKFLNDPNIGGRYSALSYFGLVPAALIGVDITRLIDNALTMASACESCVNPKENPGAWLGAAIGGLARSEGRNKLTIVASKAIESLPDWIEQLIAESTGKESRGILPVVHEPVGGQEVYGNDRLFVHLDLSEEEETEDEKLLSNLGSAGQPVIRIQLRDRYEIGKQIFQWEFAVAVAGHILGINPFDQPNVEASKESARRTISTYIEKGTLPPEEPITTEHGLAVFSNERDLVHDSRNKHPASAILSFISKFKEDNKSYVALQAFIERTPRTDSILQEIRAFLRDKFKLATTLGYGPRFLHSTGQLHKGDSGLGLFLQLTSDSASVENIPVPEKLGSNKSSINFGILTAAEALGDRKTLEENGRRIMRIDLGRDVVGNLDYLSNELSLRLETMPEAEPRKSLASDSSE